MKIIYKSEQDATEFDMDRYLESLNRYGRVDKKQVEKELEKYPYDPLHVSCLIEIAIKVLPNENSARAYFEDHKVEGQRFERLARITGYLVGDISRWNQGKMAEWAERTVSSINGEYSPENKALVEHKKRVLREEYLNNV